MSKISEYINNKVSKMDVSEKVQRVEALTSDCEKALKGVVACGSLFALSVIDGAISGDLTFVNAFAAASAYCTLSALHDAKAMSYYKDVYYRIKEDNQVSINVDDYNSFEKEIPTCLHNQRIIDDNTLRDLNLYDYQSYEKE